MIKTKKLLLIRILLFSMIGVLCIIETITYMSFLPIIMFSLTYILYMMTLNIKQDSINAKDEEVKR